MSAFEFNDGLRRAADAQSRLLGQTQVYPAWIPDFRKN